MGEDRCGKIIIHVRWSDTSENIGKAQRKRPRHWLIRQHFHHLLEAFKTDVAIPEMVTEH